MLFGTGRAMTELRALVTAIADTDVPVLIQGETGTGKELVARALASSARWRGTPFVKVNCAALPAELFEAELFGFEQGAFTGADRNQPGKFDAAHGGTIFLDEIGEIPLSHQAKLLQVLQDGHYSRVGGRHERYSSARVVAATNRDLQQDVLAGTFREDLLFRLNVIPLRVPPLRQRKRDIPQLVQLFFERWAVRHRRPAATPSPAFLERCMQYHWPGNIRELENVVQRLVLEGNDDPLIRLIAKHESEQAHTRELSIQLEAEEAAVVVTPPPFEPHSLKDVAREAAQEAERTCIAQMLVQTHGNRRRAAINLGVCYKSLLSKAKAHGL
jgi:transcriptional regulator with GAF, ATPase, and Fis domain